MSTAAKRAGSATEPVASDAVLTSAPEAGIALLTLNRPASRNALSRAMIAALDGALRAAERDPAIKVIVLTASGPAFSSGHDLKELATHRGDADGGEEEVRRGVDDRFCGVAERRGDGDRLVRGGKGAEEEEMAVGGEEDDGREEEEKLGETAAETGGGVGHGTRGRDCRSRRRRNRVGGGSASRAGRTACRKRE